MTGTRATTTPRRLARPMVVVGLVGVLVVGLAACSDSDSHASSTATRPRSSSTTASSTTPGTTTSSTTVPLEKIGLKLTQVGTFTEPSNLVTRPGTPVPYLSEKSGRVLALDDAETVVLDIRSDVVDSGEQGFLGLAFSPDGSALYVDYTASSNGETRIEEFAMNPDGTADLKSRRRLLTIAQPEPNHNGGQLAFGPDGMLYIGMGDGGAGNDEGPGHVPGGNGQSTNVLLGKILRIDPTPAGKTPYTIPAGNPFAAGGGRPEIWAYGLRNPWRFSFDRENGDLWIGDVGQDRFEEIDYMPAGKGAGANYGWNRYEGSHRFRGDDVAGTVKPIVEYSHADGCSVTGGYVYRGRAIPALVGTYLYSDYCKSTLRMIRRDAAGTPAFFTRSFAELQGVGSFGQDASGNLYLLSQNGPVYRIDPA